MDQGITVVILTFNEALHIRRAIGSVTPFAEKVIVVDSFSTDDTVRMAKDAGASVYLNPFTNHAHQFQWALDHCDIQTTWVMRMDADEYLSPDLVDEIASRLDTLSVDVTGIIVKRRVYFMGKWIRYGGYYPIKLLRIWRNGSARIEDRWMDEHMVLLGGRSVEFDHDIIDDNQNSLSWWTDKHNAYATREAIDLLDRKHYLLRPSHGAETIPGTQQAQAKRWWKNNLYVRLPLFFRAWVYFMYRYGIRLGFLDGRRGLVWHFLQGFWYRFLVDAKILQIEWWAAAEKKSVRQIISEKFGVNI